MIHQNLYCRMQHAQQSSFYNQGGNFKVAKKRKGNAYHHLEKFTAVQQLALFAPEIEITLERNAPNSPYFKARAQYKGVTIEALQQGKKKAKQALCSKIIRVSTYHLVVNTFLQRCYILAISSSRSVSRQWFIGRTNHWATCSRA